MVTGAAAAIAYSGCHSCGRDALCANLSGADPAPKLDCGHYFHQRCIEKHILAGSNNATTPLYCPVADCIEEIDPNSEIVKTSLANRRFYEVEPLVYLSLSSMLMAGATGVFGNDVAGVSLVSGYFATGFAALGLENPSKLCLLSGIGLIGLFNAYPAVPPF